MTEPISRVEEGRGGGRLPVAVAGAFAAAPPRVMIYINFLVEET